MTSPAAADDRGGWSALRPAQRFLLLVLEATSYFEGNDRTIIALALPQIRVSFGLSQSSASLWLGVLYLSAGPALVLARRADVIGRRRQLAASVVGYSVATGPPAAAPTIAAFVACQFVARLFLNAEAAVV